jgi:CelD/BcsL family acetyltransferase involved in cellulose biosynthesis
VSIRLEIVDDLARLRELEPAWSQQVSDWKQSTPFHLPGWLLTWWDHFGSGELQTIVAWEEEAIAALIPCFRHTWENARQLTLIGSGITDYLDPFIADGKARSTTEKLGAYLTHAEFDLCDWQDLSVTTPLLSLAENQQLNVTVVPDAVCSEVELEGDFDQYWQSRSSEMRRNVRRYAEKAERAGPLQFEIDCHATPCTLDALFALHTARWRCRGESGMVEANHSADFMRSASSALARCHVLRLFTLRWCERVVAAILAFSWKGRLYGYFSAFDPEHEHFGFGRILLSRCIGYAYETGHTHWNFLRGDEPYKKSWGAQCISKCRLKIRHRVSSCTG